MHNPPPPTPAQPPDAPVSAPALTSERIMAALDTIYDPEFGISIVDLGLIYEITHDDKTIHVDMALTTPACPASQVLADGIRAALAAIAGTRVVELCLVWTPPWTPDRISELGREQLDWN